MRLSAVTVYRVRIPFREAFTHASAARTSADNVVVRCQAEDGTTGWGETIAREYVTGETTEGVIARLRALPAPAWPRAFRAADDVCAFLDRAGLANVARCGLEIALLDALARQRGLPLFRYLAEAWPERAREHQAGRVRYSGPLGLASPFRTMVKAMKLRLYGFDSVKLKLGDGIAEDLRRVRLARAVLGRGVALRVDANQAWDTGYAEAIEPTLRRCGVAAVEQPFPRARGQEALAFGRRSGIPVVLDESLCSEDDARAALAGGNAVIFAVKLAKLGGFDATLRVLALAAEHGVAVQVSCQVGESAILSAAGRHLAALCPNLRYLEGSYDRFLLADNVTARHVGFSRGGWASILEGPGLGIEVDPARVERLAVERVEVAQ
jgi:L-alanine-DL-glutamate epimerase-like enolase superfamily enzyme